MTDRIVPFNYLSGRDSFSRIREHTANLFLSQGHKVHTEKWQGRDISKKPEMSSYELMNYTFTHMLNNVESLDHWREDIKPNLPWADDHFEERVCGAPINPGTEWANWPWASSADTFREERGMFGHNYMERFWPRLGFESVEPTKNADEFWEMFNRRYPNGDTSHFSMMGIRNEYGDLNDLVNTLMMSPLSRQEWFPLFHPEDVGETVDGRKPCSLGYQFWVRGGQLHMYYPLRSCDFYRHMQDDIYLAVRMLLWVLNRCQVLADQIQDSPNWEVVRPGTLTMHCTSLHVFENDMMNLRKGEY